MAFSDMFQEYPNRNAELRSLAKQCYEFGKTIAKEPSAALSSGLDEHAIKRQLSYVVHAKNMVEAMHAKPLPDMPATHPITFPIQLSDQYITFTTNVNGDEIPLNESTEIAACGPNRATVALVHATAYTDDRQVMTFLVRQFKLHGLQPVLVAPDHLHWLDGRPHIKTDWFTGPADVVFRFFPAGWLPNLGRRIEWRRFFGNSTAPLCNPATALLTQSKRWPLLCREIGLELPAWQRLLPETRDPRDAEWESDPDWVLKPALGRVGEWLGLPGVTAEREWKTIRSSVR